MLCRDTIYITPTYIIANLYACSYGKLPVGENKRIVIFPSYHCSLSEPLVEGKVCFTSCERKYRKIIQLLIRTIGSEDTLLIRIVQIMHEQGTSTYIRAYIHKYINVHANTCNGLAHIFTSLPEYKILLHTYIHTYIQRIESTRSVHPSVRGYR